MDISELLNLDEVCRRWKSLISEFVWSRMTCVDETIIDYPYGNFVERFIAICHRVEHVQEVFTGLSPEFTRGKGNPKLKEAMKDALLQVLKKLSPDAALPLSLLEDVLVLKYRMDPEKIKENDLPPIAQVRGQVAEVLQDIRAGEFEAIQVKQLSLTKPELALDPFSVKYNGRPYPMVSDSSLITRLDIGSLVALTTAEDKGGLTASQNLLSWVLCFPRLQTVTLEQLEFLKPAAIKNTFPVLTIRIKFHPQRCRLSLDEFLSFLRALGEGKAKAVRTKKIATLIDEWKTKDWIEHCEFAVHTVEFSSFMYDVKYGRDYESFDRDATRSILSRLFLTPLTCKFHIDFYHENEDEDVQDEDLLRHLHTHNVLARLREFSASFSPERGRKRDHRSDSDWDEGLAADVVLLLLRSLGGSMKNLEKLNLDFTRRVYHCPRDLLKPLKVAGPLPHLREVRCEGLPSFPFIVSLVQQAPNLRCLVITSQPVQDEHATVEWINKLLHALENSAHLSIFVLNVEGPRPSYDTGSFKVRNGVSVDSAGGRESTSAIEEQIQRVISTSPKLHRVSIDVQICELQFDLNRYGATDRLFIRE